MSAEEVSLAKLVDTAIGNPDQGAVNFNVLHGLLHAIVDKLGGDSSISTEKLQKLAPKSAKSRGDLDGAESVVTADSGLPREGTFGGNSELIDRLSTVETQLGALNSLPSNKDVFDQVFSGKGKSDGRAVSDLWQLVQVKRKAEANEEGVGRLTSLVDELMKEMAKLRRENEELRGELKDLSAMKDVWDRLAQMESQMADLRDSVSHLPTMDAFKNLVTWEGLEKALRGIREDMARMASPPERVVVNMATDPMSRPQSPGPSAALREMLESLGQLSNKHDSLEVRVDKLEHEMPNKADKADLENLKLPDDLLKQLDTLRSLVDNMRQGRDRDIEALNRIRKALTDQQKELERLSSVIDALSQGGDDVRTKLKELLEITNRLEEVKADRGLLDELLEPKADKVQLEAKVNFTLFDETTGNLSGQMEELLQKLLATEEDLRKLLQLLGADLEGKLDRLELDALKEWLEKRLKALAAKIKTGGPQGGGFGDLNEDEAAGLRRQLIQHFNCISCDRPLEIMPHPPVPSLPEKPALNITKSMRPYTTFELDSIRQHARSLNAGETADAYYTPRSAGGAHTLTQPTRRVAKQPVPTLPEEVERREETEVQGMDGHMYKARLNRTYTDVRDERKLPPVAGAKGRATSQQQQQQQQQEQQQGTRPSTSAASRESRPQSSRARPQSARVSDRSGADEQQEAPAPSPSVEMPVPAADEAAE